MPIRIITGKGGFTQMKASFMKNWKHYLQEALGLAIFMISACFFGALLESQTSSWHKALSNDFVRMVIMGILMGATALFIFYSPWTSPSGSHINPAVTLTFWRLGKMCPYDTFFFILFQFAGGTISVFVMQWIMGDALVEPPVNSVVTVPGKAGIWIAFFTEFIIAFITMSVVLFTSAHQRHKKYTRILAGCLVCCWVILAAPFSGFGMNPARSFASAFPAHTWTAFWIYLFVPFISMLLASEVYLHSTQKNRKSILLQDLKKMEHE
jgi:aquaporin Z